MTAPPAVPLAEGGRRSELHQIRLRALLREQGRDPEWVGPFPEGAAARTGSRGWALSESASGRVMGRALAWAVRAGVEDLHLVLDGSALAGAGDVGRVGSLFDPAVSVWRVEGRRLVAVPPAPAAAWPHPGEASSWAQLDLVRRLVDAGLAVRREEGAVLGEWWGLEVARVVGEQLGSEGELRLEIGVGAMDREMHRMLADGRDPDETLARVVAEARSVRRAGGGAHPLCTLVRERWLRSVVISEPALVGARVLHPVPDGGRRGLVERGVAVAEGVDSDGRPMVVVCAAGVDLEGPVELADAGARSGAQRLVLVVPRGDAPPVLCAVTDRIRAGAEVCELVPPWRTPPEGGSAGGDAPGG